jgi:hypothetical protein
MAFISATAAHEDEETKLKMFNEIQSRHNAFFYY